MSILLKLLSSFLIVIAILFTTINVRAAEGDTLFFDDFNDGNFNGWTIESGQWWINNGNLVGAKSGKAFSGRINTGDPEWDNYQIDLDMNGFQGVDGGIGFRYTPNGNSYELNLRFGTGMYGTPEVVLRKNDNGIITTIGDTRSVNLINNKWYHLKIKVLNENIKVWVDNTLVFDFTDVGTNIKKGVATVSYWTGDISVAYMRFDNIKVTALAPAPTPTPVPTKTPIIIVPGIVASLNLGTLIDKGDSGWTWMITARDGWQQFIDSLEKAGYQKDKDYFIAFYDWRKTNDWTDSDPGAALPAKKYLSEAIDKAKTANPGISKVNVVAHSMGGLVVRSYVESPNYRGDINKAFLIGSPNSGSTFAYYTWEGGEVPPNWDPVQKAGLSVMIKMLSINFLQEPYQMIHDHIKSIKDLLPIGYNYLLKNNNFIDWINMLEVNNFLKNTSNSQNTFNIFTNKGVDITNITGIGQTTWEKLQVEDFLHQYLWKDGKPLGESGGADGDNTVLTSSSNLSGAEQLTVIDKHANLPNSATSLIFNKLGINYTPSDLAGAPDEVLVAWVASPVTLTVKDSLGNSVGELLTDPETDRKWVFVENPTGDYKLELTGTGTGQYHVGVDYYTDTKTESFQTQGIAVTGAELNYDLHLDTQNPQPLDLQPEDKIPPTTSSELKGTLGNNSWYVSDVNVSLSATDNTGGSGVDKTEYSFDNTNWQGYTTPININKEGTTPVYYRSSDLVGNQEQTQEVDIKIDKTAPEVKIAVDPDQEELVVTGIDQNSTTAVKKDNLETKKKDDVIYEITDLAGNITKLDVRERDKGKQDRFAIYSIKYNDEEINKLPQNHFNVNYTGKRTRVNINEQNFELKGEVKIRIQYNQKKNQSTIIVKEPKEEKAKEIKTGLVILNLSTNHGSLEATY